MVRLRSMSMVCLEDETVLALSENRLSAEQLSQVDEHLDRCSLCRCVVAEYAKDTMQSESSTDGPATGPPSTGNALPELERGMLVDRYVVLRRIGMGSMGVVYEAFDPQLERRIALKLVRHDLGPDESDLVDRRARMLREAQAMARLSHPNVIPVYDAGTYRGQVFIVMEFVEGSTLRQEAKARKGRWQELVQLYAAAGRGLAAAHAANLVHRDFKPDNVLVGKDGRVLVGDFGLVSLAAQPPAEHQLTVVPPEVGGAADDPALCSLTQTGAILGTLRYMAPEQHQSQPASARTDQFSFCVSLYEALYGQPPFAGDNYEALRRNVIGGRPGPIEDADESAVPGWLRRLVLRGLAPRPEDRFASMAQLIAELDNNPIVRRRRRLTWLAIAASQVLVLSLGAASLRMLGTSRGRQCQGLNEPIARIWNEASKDRIRAEFLRTRLPYAADTYQRIERQLSQYAAEWSGMREQACAATRNVGTQSEHLLDLRMRCLDGKLAEMGAQVAIFSELGHEPGVLDKAVSAVSQLSPLSRCADGEALMAAFPPPAPKLREQVLALQRQLERAHSLKKAGRYQEGLRLAEQAAKDADVIGYPPVRAKALGELTQLQNGSGNLKAAEAAAKQAALAAALARYDVRLTDAWLNLMHILGNQARYEEALSLQPVVEAALTRGGDDGSQRLQMFRYLGDLFVQKGVPKRALEYCQAALTLQDKVLAPGDPARGSFLIAAGAANQQQGDYAAARVQFEAALALQEKVLGPSHPDVGRALYSLAQNLMVLGDWPAAQDRCERALANLESALGPQHHNVAAPLSLLGQILARQAKYEQAQKYTERALAIEKKTVGPEHPKVAIALDVLANILFAQGRYQEAAAALDNALAINRKAYGAKHQSVAIDLVNLGDLLLEQRKYEQARTYYQRAIEIFEATLSNSHPYVAFALRGLGRCELKLRRPDLALPLLERAVAIGTATPRDRIELAEAWFLLASAQVAAGKDRAGALDLARKAREVYAQAGPSVKKTLTEIDAWLRKNQAIRVVAKR